MQTNSGATDAGGSLGAQPRISSPLSSALVCGSAAVVPLRDCWSTWAVVASASSIICSGLALGFAYAMANGGPLWSVWLIGFVLSSLTLLASIVVATMNAAQVNILAAIEKDGPTRL